MLFSRNSHSLCHSNTNKANLWQGRTGLGIVTMDLGFAVISFHFFFFFFAILKWSENHSVMSDSLLPHGLSSSWNSAGQNTGVGSISISRGSSQPRDQIQVSHIAGSFFTSWTNTWMIQLEISQNSSGWSYEDRSYYLGRLFFKKEMYNINNGMLVNRKVQRFNQSNKIQNRNN